MGSIRNLMKKLMELCLQEKTKLKQNGRILGNLELHRYITRLIIYNEKEFNAYN